MSPRQAPGWKPGPWPYTNRALVWVLVGRRWWRVGGWSDLTSAEADAEARMRRVREGTRPTRDHPVGIAARPDARFVATWEDRDPAVAWLDRTRRVRRD